MGTVYLKGKLSKIKYPIMYMYFNVYNWIFQGREVSTCIKS